MAKDSKQAVLPHIDDFFLRQRIAEARAIVKDAADSSTLPLIVNFSGGRDSVALVGLVREVTGNFICNYMVSGIEFPEAVVFAGQAAEQLGAEIMYSYPEAHKGGFFERIATLGRFPVLTRPWCLRDLKLRPQRKTLEAKFGKGVFYKLNGVRKYESARRRVIYQDNRQTYPDPEHKGSIQVYPILQWTDADVLNYLRAKGLPSSGLYKRYGVSGCYWCPFYQAGIYRRILAQEPDLYDEFIEWEERLGKPSVIGQIYLGDLKREVVDSCGIKSSG